jgi:hypothetical protein
MTIDTITVNIKSLNDWYVATSEQINGLHVSDPDLSVVIKEIPSVIKAMYKVQKGLVVKVEQSKSADVFPLQYIAKAA